MKITSLRIENFRSFADSGFIGLGNINVFVGKNNSGKSAFLRAMILLQEGIVGFEKSDFRKNTKKSVITASLEDIDFENHFSMAELGSTKASLKIELINPVQNSIRNTITFGILGGNYGARQINGSEPNNFIYPYLAKRKVTNFDRNIDLQRTNSVGSNLIYLTSKIQRLANDQHPNAREYERLCEKVLGFKISTHAAEGGQQSGINVGSFDYIPIEDMGEGIPNLVGLITMLSLAENKLFIIEELENDIHPEALKALLEVIIDKSINNQFVISTHSNIVVKMLSTVKGSRLYRIALEKGQKGSVPTSTIELVKSTPEAKIKVLEELGYELSDFDLWSGWLFLEESSAEKIIRDYLIPFFAPKLTRVRTIAVNGTGNLEKKFENFNSLFIFTHLESLYVNKAWVIADGDSENDNSGSKAIEKLVQTYSSRPNSVWKASSFSTWNEHDFEKYYPYVFSEEVNSVLGFEDERERRIQKEVLLKRVIEWCDSTEQKEVKKAFQESASEVITRLKYIENTLFEKIEN